MVLNYAMECITGKFWEDAFNLLAILNQACQVKLEFYSITSKLVSAMHLMLLTSFVKNVESGRLDDAYNCILLFEMGLSTFYKPSECFYLFSSNRLQYLISKHKSSIQPIQESIADTLSQHSQKSDILKFSLRLPENLSSTIENARKSPKFYSWIENWKEDGFTHKYMENVSKCEKQLDVWIKLCGQIKMGTLTMSDMDSQEKTIQLI